MASDSGGWQGEPTTRCAKCIVEEAQRSQQREPPSDRKHHL
jgi:hypothetical protein